MIWPLLLAALSPSDEWVSIPLDQPKVSGGFLICTGDGAGSPMMAINVYHMPERNLLQIMQFGGGSGRSEPTRTSFTAAAIRKTDRGSDLRLSAKADGTPVDITFQSDSGGAWTGTELTLHQAGAVTKFDCHSAPLAPGFDK